MTGSGKMNRGLRLVNHAVLIALSVPCLLPLLWMISTSLKTDAQIFSQGDDSLATLTLLDFLPNPFSPENYPEALSFVPFSRYLLNTLFLCLTTTIGAVFSSAVVAYGFSRVKFAGRSVLFLLMISSMVLPAQVTMIPVFIMMGALGWYDTYLPLIVPYFLGVPFFIFLMTQFFRTIPEEISEAARIDGCSDWRIFLDILLPLSKPVLATCALFQFLAQWNDFFGPLIYIDNPDKYTLAYGLQQFLGNYGGKWSYLMACTTVFTIPIIILFFFAQRTFIQGIATTGLKG